MVRHTLNILQHFHYTIYIRYIFLSYVLLLALDIAEFKIFKPTISKAKKKAPTNICKICFLNKGVELINVHYISHD